MKIKDIVRLLILNESQNDAEEIINLFRNSGYPTRAHRVTSNNALEELLDDDPWDLLISDNKNPECSLRQAMKTIEENQGDIPVILLAETVDEAAISEGIELKVQDVVSRSNQEHLLHAALREVAGRRVLLERNSVKGTFEELQARYDQLLEGSQDAIAYITDGMHIDVNDAYAAHFGYEDVDELASMPVIDLIADGDQANFKSFLKEYAASGKDEATVDLAGQREDGTTLDMHMEFSAASYEDESCTQIVIRASGGSSSAGGADYRQMLADIAQNLVHIKNTPKGCGGLIFIQPKNLIDLRQKHGLTVADHCIDELANYLESICPEGAHAGRASAEGVAIITADKTVEAALDTAKTLITQVEGHIFEVDNETVHVDCVAGVIGLNQKSGDSAEAVINYAYAGVAEILLGNSNDKAVIYTPPAAPISIGQDMDLDELAESGRLQLLFQPIVSLRGDAGEYYEVDPQLIDHDDNAMDHHQVAEAMLDSKNESQFDRWVIFEATKRLAQKRSQGNDTRLIINVTATCLKDEALTAWLGVALKAAGLPPESLVFQIREQDAGGFVKLAEKFIAAVHKLNCKAGLTYFGDGADPLKVLKHVGASFIKISNQVVENAQSDDSGRQKLKTLIAEAAQMDATSIVPDVNNAATLATLWQLGAGFIQGGYLQEPTLEMNYEFAEIA